MGFLVRRAIVLNGIYVIIIQMRPLSRQFPTPLTEGAKLLLVSTRNRDPLNLNHEWGIDGVVYQGTRLQIEGEYERAQVRLSIYEVLGRTGLNLPKAMKFGINVCARTTLRTSYIQGNLWAYQDPTGSSTSFNGTMGLYEASLGLVENELTKQVPRDGMMQGLLKRVGYLRP